MRASTDPRKGSAATAVWRAVRDGALARQPCKCGETVGVEAHHEDYGKPLDVIWLCHSCHTRRHLELTPGKGAMERLSVSLPPPQITWLRREAKRLGVTIGELLRRIIDQVRDAQPAKEQRR